MGGEGEMGRGLTPSSKVLGSFRLQNVQQVATYVLMNERALEKMYWVVVFGLKHQLKARAVKQRS